jgi:lipid A ethanolaminephosphotransferase
MRWRLRANSIVVTAAVAAWLTLVYNLPFWRHVVDAHGLAGPMDFAFIGAVALLALLVNNLLLTPFAFRPVQRPLFALVLVLSAAASYFIAQYGVVIDQSMIRNVFETDAREARELLSWAFAAHLLLLGVLPAVLLWRYVEITPATWRRELLHKAGVLAATLAGVGLIAAATYQAQAALFRNHREVRHLLVPANYLTALVQYGAERGHRQLPHETVGDDAHKGPRWAAGAGRRVAAVIVLGETARAANFSLGGYARETNPRLAGEDGVVYFPHVTACGTATATSLPCMFSDLGRDGYDPDRAHVRDNLLDVLRHAGLEVVWLDNNSGCKGICGRVGEQRPEREPDPALCNADGCYDEILLRDLKRTLDDARSDLVVVLHQKGSHGPGYHLRYPSGFERFTPVCREIEFEKCTPREVVNAYDNTLLYTDHVVASAIDLLRVYQDHFDTALLYVSDHGESLGEHGLYLHGLPWSVAPDTQKTVPMIAWLSPPLASRFGLDTGCLAARRQEPLSHDYLFHSVLGLLDVATRARDERLDLFAPCLSPAAGVS